MEKVKWGVLGTANIAKGCTIPGMQQVTPDFLLRMQSLWKKFFVK